MIQDSNKYVPMLVELCQLAGLDRMIVEDLVPFIKEERKFYLAHWHGNLGTLVLNPKRDAI